MKVGLVGRHPELEAALDHCHRGAGGVLLVGEVGVGKSRLLAEVLDRLEADGWHVQRFVGSEATGRIPFGTMISLLPSGGGDRSQLLADVREQVRADAAGRPAAIGIDDAHLADPASTACIVDLVHHGDVVVLLTARTGEAVPADLTGLWAGDAVGRVEVTPLDGADSLALAEAFLGGPPTEALGRQLTDLAGGVPLLLRELLLDATAGAAIEQVGDAWHLVGPLHSGPRLRELMAARARRLDPGAARLLETIAVGEPVRVDLLGAHEGQELDGLEQRGLARIEQNGAGWVVRADHPLLGEAIRDGLATRRRVEVLRDLARRTVDAGCPMRGDALRVARWAAAAGDPIPPDVAVAAGHEAIAALDLDLAATLAEGVLEERVLDGHLLLGEVRRLQGRAHEAEDALAQAAGLATDEEQVVRIAMWRSTLLAHHVGEPGAAIRLLEAAAAEVSDPARALELRSEASVLSGTLGRFDDAVRTNRAILATDGLDDETAWTARINLIYAQSGLSRLEGIDEHIDAALARSSTVEEVRPEGVDLLWALRIGVATQRGELVDGEREGLARLDDCGDRGLPCGVAATILVQLLLLRGSPSLLPTVDRALRDLDESDPYASRPLALALAVLAHAAVGDVRTAAAVLDAVPDRAFDDIRAFPLLGRARAVVAAHRVGSHDAALIAAATGKEAIRTSHVPFGVLALHEAACLGHPELVVDDLTAVTAGTSAPLLRALSTHASALHAGDPEALELVASSFERMGARPLVARAHADAAERHDGATAARRAAARSLLWSHRAAPIVTPSPEVDGAVSPRELEVAVAAAAGQPSRTIGEQLFLSVRTVDNHLRRVYEKLEVSSRIELQDVLEPAVG